MTVAVNLLLAGLCCVGHAALLVAILNRIDSGRVRRWVLNTCSQLHRLAMLAYPIALLAALFYLGDGTTQSLWDTLPTLLRWYSYACLVISAVIPMRVLQNVLRTRPAVLQEERSRRIDLRQELGERATAPTGHHRLLRIPGNESLIVDANQKHLQLPGLPAVWDGLTILHFSDTHFTGAITREWFERVCQIGQEGQPDLILFTGDLLDRPELIAWLPETLGRMSAPLGCWFILGNHDWYTGTRYEIRQRLVDLGWTDAAAEVRIVNYRDRRLMIAGIERPWMGTVPSLESVPGDAFRLLLSHTPDQIAWARRQKIDLMVAGHTHGGQIRVPLLGPIYCPSTYGPLYASGVFWEPPTVLHVSRGLSGEAPIRFNCTPELTRLVLHPSEPGQRRTNVVAERAERLQATGSHGPSSRS